MIFLKESYGVGGCFGQKLELPKINAVACQFLAQTTPIRTGAAAARHQSISLSVLDMEGANMAGDWVCPE